MKPNPEPEQVASTNWWKNVDPDSGATYYVNAETKISQWEIPDEVKQIEQDLKEIDQDIENELEAEKHKLDIPDDADGEPAKPQGRPAAELNEREVAGEQSRGRTSEVEFKGEDHSDPFYVPHELLNEFAPQELEEIIGQFHEVF
jgi:hypothetical protein